MKKILFFILAILPLCLHTAYADTTYHLSEYFESTETDDCSDLGNLYAVSDNIIVSTSSPSKYGGDTARYERTALGPEGSYESVIYETDHQTLGGFCIDTAFYADFEKTDFKFYISSDAIYYQEIFPESCELYEETASYKLYRYTATGFPSSKYLKIEFRSRNQFPWMPTLDFAADCAILNVALSLRANVYPSPILSSDNTLIDTCNDTSLLYENSSDIVCDDATPEYFSGDSARFTRMHTQIGQESYILYKVPGKQANTLSVWTYFYESTLMEHYDFAFYASSDLNSFQEIKMHSVRNDASKVNAFVEYLYYTDMLPQDTTYIKIVFTSQNVDPARPWELLSWDVSVGRVEIGYEDAPHILGGQKTLLAGQTIPLLYQASTNCKLESSDPSVAALYWDENQCYLQGNAPGSAIITLTDGTVTDTFLAKITSDATIDEVGFPGTHLFLSENTQKTLPYSSTGETSISVTDANIVQLRITDDLVTIIGIQPGITELQLFSNGTLMDTCKVRVGTSTPLSIVSLPEVTYTETDVLTLTLTCTANASYDQFGTAYLIAAMKEGNQLTHVAISPKTIASDGIFSFQIDQLGFEPAAQLELYVFDAETQRPLCYKFLPFSGNRTQFYTMPDAVGSTTQYAVSVRTDGGPWKDIPVIPTRTLANGQYTAENMRASSIASFDLQGAAEIRITAEADVETFSVKTLDGTIPFEVVDNSIIFTLTHPEKLVIETDGDKGRTLQLFINSVERVRPAEDNDNVIYLKPGYYTQDNCSLIQYQTLRIPSGKTLYLEGGAVVRASVKFENVENAALSGRGMISLADWNTQTGLNDGTSSNYLPAVVIIQSNNIRVDGIIINRSCYYSICMQNSANITLDNLKIISSQINSDGINGYSCHDITITNCFVRSSDDGIAIYNDASDSYSWNVQDTALWSDGAHAIFIGLHGTADSSNRTTIQNLIFKNIYIPEVYCQWKEYFGVIGIVAGDENICRDITFEDIRIDDYSRSKLFEIRTGTLSDYNPVPGYLVENIIFRNISYNGDYYRYDSTISGYNSERVVNHIVFENFYFNGKKVTSAADADITIEDYAYNILFQ